jgi:hypothetical protein
MGMLPVQGDAGFHEGGQYVHLTEVNPVPFEPDPRDILRRCRFERGLGLSIYQIDFQTRGKGL